MLYIYLEAPFAACRTFTAGLYRPTATFLTPSTVYGLLLNVAGIESRLREEHPLHPINSDKIQVARSAMPASLTQPNLPHCRLALGLPGNDYPRLQSVYQQLHDYPVGESGAGRAGDCHGNKYNIRPVRRELLSDLRAIIALDGTAEFVDAVRLGLRGEGSANRYGVPYLGDNSFLLDRLEEITWPSDRFTIVQWYERIGAETKTSRPRATRLTIFIDRADLSKTQSALFAPTEPLTSNATPPLAAWVDIKPPQLEITPPAATAP